MQDIVSGFAGFGASGLQVMLVATAGVRNRPPPRALEHFASRTRDAPCCGIGGGVADQASRRRP
jgi:hypothetical protein